MNEERRKTSAPAGPPPAPHPVRELILARLREFWREPAAIFWVYGFPLIMMIALGVAFRNRPAATMTVDILQSGHAENVAAVLGRDPRFAVRVNDRDTCQLRLRTGKTELVVVLDEPAGSPLAYRFDPTKPGSRQARDAVDDALQRAAGRADKFTARNQELAEPGGRYIDFLVPGLLGMGLLGGGLWGVGFALVDMRIRKLLKRFAATPMKQSHFMGALMISRLAFTVPEVLMVLLFSWLGFGVVNYGSNLAVLGLIVLGAFQFAGIGLLLASRAQTLETASGLMNLVMIPMWIGSGIFFSTDRFPQIVQPLIHALPLTPLINALRAVINEGASLTSLGLELGAMTAWTLVTFALALRWFRWS